VRRHDQGRRDPPGQRPWRRAASGQGGEEGPRGPPGRHEASLPPAGAGRGSRWRGSVDGGMVVMEVGE
jgi:hypothetical protein